MERKPSRTRAEGVLKRTIRRPISKMIEGEQQPIPTCQGEAVVSFERRKGRLLLKIEYPASLDATAPDALRLG